MQAVILAAGKSERFYPFVSFGHKSMVSLLGKSLLQQTLESLQNAKVHSVVIVVSENSSIPEKIIEVPGLDIRYVVQQDALGMGHALLQAEPFLEEKFFLLSGYHMDIAEVAESLLKQQKHVEEVVLLVKEDTMHERYGMVEVHDEHVVSLIEKPTQSAASLRVVAMYLLSKAFLQTLKALPLEQYHFEKALDIYAKKGLVRFALTQYPTITLKHSWDLLSVKDYLLSRIKRSISKKAVIAKSAIIEGNVVVSDNVRILEGACIKGPCFLGEGVVVGNNAIVRNGVVAQKGAVIGATMEVKNSILMEGVTTHTGFIGDSVIGQQSRLAAGFCTANVRFDRQEVRSIVHGKVVNTYKTHIGAVLGEQVDSGTNVSTMPGVCIGNNVTIGPSTVVAENVADNMLFYTKFTTIHKKKKIT